MRARSIVFDIFGDYVRATGGRISLQKLTRVLECFEVPADSARVVMSRMAREGWFSVERNGRESVYEPSSKGWELLDSGLERIMSAPVMEGWDGTWFMANFSVPESERSARTRLKTKFSWLGFGQLAPSTWLSVHDRLAEADEALAAEPCAKYDLFTVRGRGPRSDAERAGSCWDLAALAEEYRAFDRARRDLRSDPSILSSGRRALTARTRLIHEYRKFPFRDPALPIELLPEDWPAGAVYRDFLETFNELGPPAMEYFLDLTGATLQDGQRLVPSARN